jgi:glucosamine kinase
MAYFLGIDAGASKTAALLGDEHRKLGVATDSSCKIQVVGEEKARGTLQGVIAAACQAAQVEPKELKRICIGISGVSRTDIPQKIRGFVADITAAETIVVGDQAIAFEAAFGGDGTNAGVLVIGGTGSMAYGRNEQGAEARAGGDRAGVFDQGSGCWIGQRALQAARRAMEAALGTKPEAAERPFVQEVLQAAEKLDKQNGASLADLFPIVVRACENGDAEARKILQEAAGELARLAQQVITRLWPTEAEPVSVAVIGGVFGYSSVVRESFAENLRRAGPRLIIDLQVVDAAEGALAIARRG